MIFVHFFTLADFQAKMESEVNLLGSSSLDTIKIISNEFVF